MKIEKKIVYGVLILMSPALMIGPIREIFNYWWLDNYVTPYMNFLCLISIIIIPITFKYLNEQKEKIIIPYKSLIPLGIEIIYLLVLPFIKEGEHYPINYIGMITIPIIIAYCLSIIYNKEEILRLHKIFSIVFVVYLFTNIIIWYFILSKKQVITEGLGYSRMGGSFSENVTLGYLISALFPTILFHLNKLEYKKRVKVFLKAVLFIIVLLAVILTGTRGALYYCILMLFMWSFYIKKKYYWSFFVIFLLFITVANFPQLSNNFSRFMNTEDKSRTSSWSAAITYWNNYNLDDKIFGRGLGNLYPYTHWVKEGSQYWANTFYLDGNISVVQPHNSYIWFLMETGIFSIIMILWFLINCLKHIYYTGKKSKSIYKKVILLSILGIIWGNNFDSIFIIMPNVALIFWFYLFSSWCI